MTPKIITRTQPDALRPRPPLCYSPPLAAPPQGSPIQSFPQLWKKLWKVHRFCDPLLLTNVKQTSVCRTNSQNCLYFLVSSLFLASSTVFSEFSCSRQDSTIETSSRRVSAGLAAPGRPASHGVLSSEGLHLTSARRDETEFQRYFDEQSAFARSSARPDPDRDEPSTG